MTSKTYSGNYTTGITLGANNPIYITGTVTTTSGDGVKGISLLYTVVNSGRIETSAYNGSGSRKAAAASPIPARLRPRAAAAAPAASICTPAEASPMADRAPRRR